MNRNDLIAAFPLADFLRRRGHELKREGKELATLCPFHADRHPSMRVNEEKQTWYCDPCGFGGSVIDYLMRAEGLNCKDAMRRLGEDAGLWDPNEKGWRREGRYQYRDQYGRPVMEVERHEKGTRKKFVQYRATEDGGREPGIDGVQRVLYRLDQWAQAEYVSLTEGEKCVHALEEIGVLATTNPGGSNGWLDAYAAYLDGKMVDIWPDRDEPGEKWLQGVLRSLEGKVKGLRVLRVPEPYQDVADLLDAQGLEMAQETCTRIRAGVPYIERGVTLPLLSAREMVQRYQRRIQAVEHEGIDLGHWLPSLRRYGRLLLPGDLVAVLADTGTGKTAILNNIAHAVRPMRVIYFQLELAPEPMAERFLARAHSMMTIEVERAAREGKLPSHEAFDHIFLCPESRVTLERMREIVERAELKVQGRPGLVLVDYIGLMGGSAAKRYERLSDLAEGLKVLARETDTVFLLASQVRRDDSRLEISLHDAKDSGSIENSAQLVLGAWRPAVDRMTIRVLKQTKRAGQFDIECLFDGDRQLIVELPERQEKERS